MSEYRKKNKKKRIFTDSPFNGTAGTRTLDRSVMSSLRKFFKNLVKSTLFHPFSYPWTTSRKRTKAEAKKIKADVFSQKQKSKI